MYTSNAIRYHPYTILNTSGAPECVTATVTGLDEFDGIIPYAYLGSFDPAARTRRGILLRWRTASETQTLGFNVYRGGVRLNRSLIPGVFAGTTIGQAYTWLDGRAPHGGTIRYRIQAVELDGTRSWVGSTRAP